MAENNNKEKLFLWESFRIMATWFASYITNKFNHILTTANSSINSTKDSAITAVNGAKTTALEAINSAGTSAVSDVNSAKSTALGDISTVKTQAETNINNAKNQALAAVSIVNTGSASNVLAIYDYFSANPSDTLTTVNQQWPGENSASDHTVFRTTMYV